MPSIFRWAFQAALFYRTRSLLTVCGIGLASSLVMSTLAFNHGYRRSLKQNIDAMGYQILVTGKGCPHEAATLVLRGGVIPMYVQQTVADDIAARPEVQDLTRFLMQVASQPDGSRQLYVGIDERFLSLKPDATFQRGGWFSSPEADEAILGYNVADYLRLGLGDAVKVRGARLVVRGILDKLGTQDDGTVFTPLATAQTIFEKRDRLTGIGVRMKDMNEAGPFIDRLYDLPSVQVVRLSQVQETILRLLEGVRGLLLAFGGVCLLIALTGMFNVALIAAQARQAELGTLRALGCSKGRLFALVWSESLLLGVAGALLGTAMTLALRRGTEASLRAVLAYVPDGDVIALTPGIVAAGWALVAGLCLLAAAYPAWTAAQAPPLRSIRGRA